eukprot:CAMPEP_0173353126 /NCGR_PEP_ID=MMETSP1144-20121109/16428_1 /TAXON_ID=483371 /ORGANISM="non described non described, Strain CCMP2298" /LENGTH=40 /DNA_ID= /DNA_START= /DNA_END= /DNA_ORIENTATION=
MITLRDALLSTLLGIDTLPDKVGKAQKKPQKQKQKQKPKG